MGIEIEYILGYASWGILYFVTPETMLLFMMRHLCGAGKCQIFTLHVNITMRMRTSALITMLPTA